MSWQTVPQPRTCSSKTSVSMAAAGPSDDTSLSWQSAADDDLRRRPADSRRPGKVEPNKKQGRSFVKDVDQNSPHPYFCWAIYTREEREIKHRKKRI